ncbi:MAG: hypothetical protein H0V33_09625 [Acidimicrobiia bacterium]|nr:hypothetical protein [Acidimicrobiia bacterium]
MRDRAEMWARRWAAATGDLPPLRTTERQALAGVLTVGVVLRLAWCVYAARPPGPALHDPFFYRFYGEQLANGNGYRLPDGSPTAYYPPGYPLALAALFWLGDLTPLTDEIQTGLIAGLNIACQLALVLTAFAVARRLVPGTRSVTAGLVAGAVIALWPNLILHTAVALSESLFLALLMGAVLAAVSGPWGTARVSTLRLVAVGVLLGAATLVRPVSLPLLGALLVAWLAGRAGWRRALGRVALVTGCTLAVLGPWVVRNAVVMDAVALSTNTGDNLCMSRRVGGSGGFEFPNDRCNSGPFTTLARPAFEVERDEHGRRVAFDFVAEHPGEEVRLWFRRAGATFSGDADGVAAVESYGSDPFLPDGLRRALVRVADGWYVVMGAVALIGVVAVVRRPTGPRVLVVASFAGLLGPPIAFFGDQRFKVPAVSLAAVAIGVVVAEALCRRDGGSERVPAAAPHSVAPVLPDDGGMTRCLIDSEKPSRPHTAAVVATMADNLGRRLGAPLRRDAGRQVAVDDERGMPGALRPVPAGRRRSSARG